MDRPENELPLWVIFHNPSDYPDKYVVKVQTVEAGGTIRLDDPPVAVVDTIEEARAAIPKWCVNLGRKLDDELQIAEVWV